MGTVVEVQVPVSRQQVITTAMVHFAAIFGASVTMAAGDRADLLTPYAAHFAERSAQIGSQHSFYEGLEMETAIHLAVADAMAGCDALVCPTMGTNALRAGDDYVGHGLTVAGVELDFYFECGLTTIFNIASKHPVLAVPSGLGANGAPTGVQIVAPTYDDATAFRVGAALERELGWWHDPSWHP